MEKTTIKEVTRIELKNPVLVEGLPGLGMVGRIATRYLAKQLKAKKLANLYSPHFPYYVLVNKKGSVRLLRGEFYFWKNEAGENDLILFTGDSQAQTIEGQYDVASCILDFAERNNVKVVVTIGGYRKEVEETPKVVAASPSSELLNKALQAKAIASPVGNPIVGTAGLLLGMARFRKIDAVCLLGETRGYLPDPRAAKSVLEVLQRMLRVKVDLSGLDEEIEKSKGIVERMKEIEERREKYAQKMRRGEEERITYIS
ncbi:MAG: PAC2 family protein [Candidatus Bathyarchaeota archaeon BA2]|nr:MAG: PAC2 family protein [Candidatus Bathyarchaeota archaeon BA2]